MIEQKIPMKDIIGETNRQYGGDGEIGILAEDMKRNGQIHPITLKLHIGDDGNSHNYNIVAGRRRFAAAKMLGWAEIKASILEPDEEDLAEAIAGSENINRLNMHPLDEAKILKALIVNGESVENLAKQYDRPKSAIWQRVQLLDLGDGVKDLFRQGRISLLSAAMLKSLDAEQQESFCKKFENKYKEKIPDFEVQGYIAGARHDRLYQCVAGKDCAACQKRTFYSNRELFPELEGEGDFCLDHGCYISKWLELLSGKIKTVKAEHKGHADANIIACDDKRLERIFGKKITVEGVDYAVVQIHWSNRPDNKQTKTSKPCFVINLKAGKITVESRYWKEPAEEKAQQQALDEARSSWVPVVNILDLPKEEAAATIKTLVDKNNKLNHWEFNGKVQEKIFWKLMEEHAKKKPAASDIALYFDEKVSFLDGDEKKFFKLFTGLECSIKNISELIKLPKEKLFRLLVAMTFGPDSMPEPDDLETGIKNDLITWLGINPKQLRELYKEEIKALLPKPKATAGKPAKGKKTNVRKCRVCGCTYGDCSGCIEKAGIPCHWVEEDLCSACADEAAKKKQPKKKPAKAKQAKKTAAVKTAKKKKPAAKKPAAPKTKKYLPGHNPGSAKGQGLKAKQKPVRVAKSAADTLVSMAGDPAVEM